MTAEGVGSEKRGIGVPLRVRNLQRREKVDGLDLRSFLLRVADELGRKSSTATLVLVDDIRIRGLNRVFRGIDRPTDVLSFSAGPSLVPEDEDYLGDIVISVETARRQARRRGSTLSRELRVLALHGYLHLLGYDHQTDKGDMRRIEYRLRRKFGITRPNVKGAAAARSGKRTKKK